MTHTLKLFFRLLAFTKPYKWRLLIGLLAGFSAGGSLFGVFQFAPGLLTPFEQGIAAPSGTVQAAPAARPAAETEIRAAPPAAAPGTASKAKGEGLNAMEKLARYFHMPTANADGTIYWKFMLLTVIGLPLCLAVKSLATFVNHYCLRWVGSRVVADMRNALFDRLLDQSLRYFGKVDIGHLISRCTYDAAMIENTISNTVADCIQAPMELAAAVIFIVWYASVHNLLGMVVLVFIAFPLAVVPIIVIGRYVKRYSRRSLERISDLVSRMQEIFTGIRVVKAYHTETAESTRFHGVNNNYFHAVIKALRAELFMNPLMEVIAGLGACAFIVYCYAEHIKLSEIVSIGLPAVFAYRPVKQLAKMNANLQRGVAAAERLFAILDTNTALPEKPNALKLREFRDCIEFRQVDFAYDAGGMEVLKEISFTMPRGAAVAFVGETGAGKSTIAGLLARFYDPTAGQVLLDGTDLRDIEIASLRSLIGVVTQETILFNDTIASNIAYGTPGASREQVIEAARKANAHEFIMAETENYGRVVGEKGFRLSGGQRQRIAIARAILRNPPILILDEATSALDSVTERLVQEALYRLMQDRTVFAIAHRLSTVKHCSRIFVLDKGRIVEHGTHADLYAAGHLYRRLCNLALTHDQQT